MTQYFTDFSDYTTGSKPSDWTVTYEIPDPQWTVKALAGATGGKVLDYAGTASSGALNLRGIYWDLLGTAASGNIEIVYKWRRREIGIAVGDMHGVGILFGDYDSLSDDENGYVTAWERSASTSYRLRIIAIVDGSPSTLTESMTPTGQEPTIDVWYWTRFRINGTTLSTKTWTDGSAEPGTWDASTSSSTFTSGFIGLGTIDPDVHVEFDLFGVGTNGDTAPITNPNTAPLISVTPVVDYDTYTKLGTGNTPVDIAFTATDTEQTTTNALLYEIRTATSGSGTLIATGNCTNAIEKIVALAYNVAGLVNGSQTLYLRVSDGTLWSADSSFILLRDTTNPTITGASSDYDADTGTYTITFTPTDTYSTDVGELSYQVRTASGGGGTIVLSGTTTTATPTTTSAVDEGLAEGTSVNRYLRVFDSGGNVGTATVEIVTPFPEQTVTPIGITGQENISVVDVYVGERFNPIGIPSEENIGSPLVETSYVPSRVIFSLADFFSGLYGPIQYSLGLRYYNSAGILLGDLSEITTNMTIDWDMNRSIQRSFTFSLIGNDIPLESDHLIEPFALVQVYDPNTNQVTPTDFSLGFYVQTTPRKSIGLFTTSTYTANDRITWLVEKTSEEQRTFTTGGNYGSFIRTLAMEAGFTDRELLLPITYETLAAPLTFPPGTSYFEMVHTLADAVNWSNPYMTNDNKFKIIERKDFTTMEKKQAFATDATSIILPDVIFSTRLLRIANKIIITVNDPLREPFTATYINDHLDNIYSRSVTGITVTETIDSLNYIANETVATDRALLEAQLASSNAEIELKTLLDFTREPYEIYSIFVTDQETGNPLIYSDWYCIAWSMDLSVGGQTTMQLRNILPV